MFIIIVILIVSLVKLNKEDSIMKKYRIKQNEMKTMQYSNASSNVFNNSRIQQTVYK